MVGSPVYVAHSRSGGAFVVMKALNAYYIKHQGKKVGIFLTSLPVAKAECDRLAEKENTVIVGSVVRTRKGEVS